MNGVWVTGGSFLAPVESDGSKVARLAPLDPIELLGPERTRRLDPLSQLSLCVAEQAFGSAQLDRESLSGSSMGVSVGSALAATVTSVRYARRLVAAGPQATNPIDFPDSIDGAIAAHLALDCGLKGPSVTFVSGRQSANHAVAYAARVVTQNRVERMLVVVGDLLDPLFVEALSEGGASTGNPWAEALLALVIERPGLREPPPSTVRLSVQRAGDLQTSTPSIGLRDPSGALELAEAFLAVRDLELLRQVDVPGAPTIRFERVVTDD